MNTELKDALIQLEDNVYKKIASNGVQVHKQDELKALFRNNHEAIKKANRKALELKVVGDMGTATNLTGDPNRFYSNNVSMVPSQAVNIVDLIQTVNIDTGVFVFPKETGSEGSISVQTEGQAKSQIDYDLEMVTVNTDYLAGWLRVSKQMLNNLPYVEDFLPMALKRDFYKAQNTKYWTELAAALTPSTQLAGNHVTRLTKDIAVLLNLNYSPSFIVVNPSDYAEIILTAGTSGTGDYSLPGAVTMAPNGLMNLNGVYIVVGTFVPADKYLIADWSYFMHIVSDSLNVAFFEQDGTNITQNLTTIRIEQMEALAITSDTCGIYGDFTQTT